MIPFYYNSLTLLILNAGKMYSIPELKFSSDTKSHTEYLSEMQGKFTCMRSRVWKHTMGYNVL